MSAEASWLSRTADVGPIELTSMLGALVMRRTVGGQYRETVLPAMGGSAASVKVDAAKLMMALRRVTGKITLGITEDGLSIRSANRVVRISSSWADSPAWPLFQADADSVAIGAVQLARVLTSAGVDESLPALKQVHFAEGLMVTTDRFRLSRVRYADTGFTATVPADAVRAMAGRSGVVDVSLGRCINLPGEWVELSTAGRSVWTATTDGVDLPRWKQLIPQQAPVRVAVRREDLLYATGGDEVTLTLSPPDGDDSPMLTMISHSSGMEIEEEVKLVEVIRYDCDGPTTVGLRSRFLTDALVGAGSGLILLDFVNSNQPVMVRGVSENDVHLIMPVR